MKKRGILHNELAQTIASLGHGQILVIGDAGLPVPKGVRCIDLAVTKGVPTFAQVLLAVAADMQIERYEIAHETVERSPGVATSIAEALVGVELGQVSHEELKRRSELAVAIIRTGEFTPFANVLLYAGVVF
jgi:D-ribose pyranase